MLVNCLQNRTSHYFRNIFYNFFLLSNPHLACQRLSSNCCLLLTNPNSYIIRAISTSTVQNHKRMLKNILVYQDIQNDPRV